MSTVKTSKYRFTKPTPCRPDRQFLNVAPTSAIWDCSNFIACNSKYVAVPWSTLGSVVVLHHDQVGKLPSMPSMFMGHTAPVIDCAFHPYDDSLLFTASEDATIKGWKVPEGGLKSSDVPATVTLTGHSRKVGILSWHPSAENVLASAAIDSTIMLWDVTQSASKVHFQARDVVWSLNWNLDGSLISTTTKDKHLAILDPRTGGIVAAAEAHPGAKTQRSIWAKRKNLLVTLGFGKTQFRQAMVWDPRNISKPLHIEEIDQASSVMMPVFDEDTNMLYVAGKGDTSIRYYHLWDDGPTPIVYLNMHQSTDPQKGVCMMPKTTLDVKNCEVARFYKLASKQLGCIQFHLPRKASTVEFQDDVYPPTFANEPAITSAGFFAGQNSAPREMSLRGLFDGTQIVAGSVSAVQHDAIQPQSPEEPAAAAKPAASPPKRVEPVAVVAPLASLEWDGSSPPTEAHLKRQQAKVDELSEQLHAAQARLDAMHAMVPKPAKPATPPPAVEAPTARTATPPPAQPSVHEAAAQPQVARTATPQPEQPARAATPQAEAARTATQQHEKQAEVARTATPQPEKPARAATPQAEVARTATPQPEKPVTPRAAAA